MRDPQPRSEMTQVVSTPPPLEPDGEPAEPDPPHGGDGGTAQPRPGGHEGPEGYGGGWVAPGAPPGWDPPPGPGPGTAGWSTPGWGAAGYQAPVVLPKGGSARTGPLPLHPMSLGDVLDGAFRLLKANLATIVLVTAVFFVPLELVSAFLTRDLFGGQSVLNVLRDPTVAEQGLVGGMVTSLVGLLVTPFVGGAVTKVVGASYLGDRLSAGEAVKTTGRRFWALLGAAIFVHVVEGVGLLLLVLPALAAMAFLICTTPAVVIEGLGPVKGMRRSAALVRRRFWPVLGTAVVSGLMTWFLTTTLRTPFAIGGELIGLRWGFILLAVGSIVPALLATPFGSSGAS